MVKAKLRIKKIHKAQKTVRRKIRKAPQAKKFLPASYDIEGFFIGKMLDTKALPENGTEIENLLYSATPKIAEIAYSFGFGVGRQMCQAQQGANNFSEILDRIGFHRALFYPLKDSMVITSTHSSSVANARKHLHIYQAGIMSGYLSMSTGVKINTVEKKCKYNGSNFCQFVAVPLSTRHIEHSTDLQNTIDCIAKTVAYSNFMKLKDEYYRPVAFLPLLRQPINEQIKKLLFMSGERLAEITNEQSTRSLIKNISNYFGARECETFVRNRGKSIINLRYESYNSIYPYVSLPTALISGLIFRRFGQRPSINISTNKDNTYTVSMEFKSK